MATVAESSWFIVVLGVAQGALLPPLWRCIFRGVAGSISSETQQARVVVMLLVAIGAIAVASSVVLLGPVYLLGIESVRQPGSAWSISWASAMVAVFAAYYGWRKFGAGKAERPGGRHAA